jgi:hypothetical protein
MSAGLMSSEVAILTVNDRFVDACSSGRVAKMLYERRSGVTPEWEKPSIGVWTALNGDTRVRVELCRVLINKDVER